MNPKLQKLGTVAALLVMTATAQAGAPDPRHDDTKPLLVSLSRDAASSSRLSSSRASRPEDPSPLTYDFVFPDEAPEGQGLSRRYSVQLYPIDKGTRSNGVAGAARPFAVSAPGGRGVARSEELSATERTLPEPGSWSMILVALLGVGAIARRRMSA